MWDNQSNTWLWVILAIIFFVVAVVLYYAQKGFSGWYWLFIALGVIALILALFSFWKDRQIKEVRNTYYGSPRGARNGAPASVRRTTTTTYRGPRAYNGYNYNGARLNY